MRITAINKELVYNLRLMGTTTDCVANKMDMPDSAAFEKIQKKIIIIMTNLKSCRRFLF